MAVKKINEVYKCSVCGNVITVLEVGGGELVCCDKPMILQEEKTQEQEGKEKHVPVIEKTEEGTKIKVGSIPHPMEKEHFIEWIEVLDNGKSCRKFLKPGDAPEALPKADMSNDAVLRIYCNVHGLWKS
ncbi:desulfoferrodoxin [Candidatus Woesearchaeota archaeon]|nr:desulfoferrodoxin [Candidatus Woesearchaeota archaeon]